MPDTVSAEICGTPVPHSAAGSRVRDRLRGAGSVPCPAGYRAAALSLSTSISMRSVS